MKTIVLAYVPPPAFQTGPAFFKNISEFKTEHQLVLYSDHGYPGVVRINNPEMVKGKSHWSVNNLAFLTGLRVAAKLQPDRIIYVESDCRVGADYWDLTLSQEMDKYPDALIGGSMICYSPCNWDREFANRWSQCVSKNLRRNFPIPTYGAGGSAERREPCVFVNGALGIYNFKLMYDTFGELKNTVNSSSSYFAWDWEIGKYLWKVYKHGLWEKVAHLTCIYSSYGDVLTDEAERQRMLMDGEVVAIHQIKSTWIPDPVVLRSRHGQKIPNQVEPETAERTGEQQGGARTAAEVEPGRPGEVQRLETQGSTPV